MKTPILLIPALVISLVSSGCTINESVGPQGPPGNANVYSLNFIFSMDDAALNGTVASVQFDSPDLTESVVDEGAVLLFVREQGTWTALPYTFGVESEEVPAVDYTVSLGYGFELGFLEVYYEASSTVVDLLAFPDRSIKAVIIDGFFGKRSIDLTDWEQVKEFYDLDE